METPDTLPRAMEYWFFAAKVGQAMELLDLPSPNRIPSAPPVGKFSDKIILIHLEGYEDWSPQSPGSSSSNTSSEHGSSIPPFIPFDWVAGVLDGQPMQARSLLPRNGGCNVPAESQPRHDQDPDGDHDGPRQYHDVPWSTRVRQLFPGCATERSARPVALATPLPAGWGGRRSGRCWSWRRWRQGNAAVRQTIHRRGR